FSARHSSVYTIRRSPRSPLFPYATLFRSLVSRLRFQPFLRHAHPALPAAVVLAAVGQPPLRAAHGPAPAARVLPAVLGRRSPLPAVALHHAAPLPDAPQPQVKQRPVVGHQQVDHLVQQRLIHFLRKLFVVVRRQADDAPLRVAAPRGAGHAPAPLDGDVVRPRQQVFKIETVEALVALVQLVHRRQPRRPVRLGPHGPRRRPRRRPGRRSGPPRRLGLLLLVPGGSLAPSAAAHACSASASHCPTPAPPVPPPFG